MDVAVPASAGALRGALQCAVAVVPECVVAECWMQGSTGDWDQLVAFLTPSPLVATHVGADGKPTQRTIDLATAQAFASQHKLSIKLATKVSMTGATEWCQEPEIRNSGDVLLAKLTFGIGNAIAVPVMQQRGLEATDVSCPAVLVFYSSKKEQASLSISSALLAVGRSAGAALQLREEEQEEERGQDQAGAGDAQHRKELAFAETCGSVRTPSTTHALHQGGGGPALEGGAEQATGSASEAEARPVEVWQNAVLGAAKLAACSLRARCGQVWVLDTAATGASGSSSSGSSFTLLAELQPHVIRPPSGEARDVPTSSDSTQATGVEGGSGTGAAKGSSSTGGGGRGGGPRSSRRSAGGQDSSAAGDTDTATTSPNVSSEGAGARAVRASRSSRAQGGGAGGGASKGDERASSAAAGGGDESSQQGTGTVHTTPASSAPAPSSPPHGSSAGGPTLPALSSQLCVEAVATAHLQPAVWLGPHDMAARLMHYQSWSGEMGGGGDTPLSYQAAVGVPLRVVVGSAREESRARSLYNLQHGGGGGKGSLGPPVTVVLVFYWLDPHPACCTPSGTTFLATIAQTARTACATAPPPPAGSTTAAAAALTTHAQRSSAASGGGVGLPRPSSGLDLLAALGARGRAESTGYAPPSQEGNGDAAPAAANDALAGSTTQDGSNHAAPPRAPSMQAILRASAHDLQALEHQHQHQHSSSTVSAGHKRGRPGQGEDAHGTSSAVVPSVPGMHASFSMGHLLPGGVPLSMDPVHGHGHGHGHGGEGMEGGLNMEAEDGEESDGEEEGQDEGEGVDGEEGVEGEGPGVETALHAPGVPTKAPGRGRRGRRHRGRSKRQSAPYSLHPSEHGHMTISGLPAVSATALARVKGRSRAPAPKMAVALRRGKWPNEEEELTTAVVDAFKAGLLPLANGTTLRTYLSGQLHCAPMRITKKFAKDASIGKQVYAKNSSLPEDQWSQQSQATCSRIRTLRQRFFQAVLAKNRIDLALIVPDPFPADGIVQDTISQYYDDNGEPIALGEGGDGLMGGMEVDEHGMGGGEGVDGSGGMLSLGMGGMGGRYMQHGHGGGPHGGGTMEHEGQEHGQGGMAQQEHGQEQQAPSIPTSSSKRARRGGGGGGGGGEAQGGGAGSASAGAGASGSAHGSGHQGGSNQPSLMQQQQQQQQQQQGGSLSYSQGSMGTVGGGGPGHGGAGGGGGGKGGLGQASGASFVGMHPAMAGQMGMGPMTMGNMMDMAAMGMGMGHPMLASFAGGGGGPGGGGGGPMSAHAWPHTQYGQAMLQQQQQAAMGMMHSLPWVPVGSAMLNGQGGSGSGAAAAAGFQQAQQANEAAVAAAMAAANAGQQFMMQQHRGGAYGSMVMGAPPAPGKGGSSSGMASSSGSGAALGAGGGGPGAPSSGSGGMNIGMRLPIPASASFGMMNMPGFAMAGGMPMGMGMGMGMGGMSMQGGPGGMGMGMAVSSGGGGGGQGGTRGGPAFASYADLSGLGLAMSPTAGAGASGSGGGAGGGGGYAHISGPTTTWTRNGQQGGGGMHPSASATSLGLHLDNTPLLQGQPVPTSRGKGGVHQSDSLLDIANAAARS